MHYAVAGIICMCGGMLWYGYVVYVCMRYMRGALWRVCVVWHIVYGVECDMVMLMCVFMCVFMHVCAHNTRHIWRLQNIL